MYATIAVVFFARLTPKPFIFPLLVMMVSIDLETTKSVCSQWRNVVGCVLDGISRSTIIIANELAVTADGTASIGA